MASPQLRPGAAGTHRRGHRPHRDAARGAEQRAGCPLRRPAAEARMSQMVSVVIPIYNEALNIDEMYDRITSVLQDNAEFIFVDDGSTDDSHARLKAIAARDDRVRLLRFRRNFGQTA